MKIYHIDTVTPSQNQVDNMHWAKKRELRDFLYWCVKDVAGISTTPETLPVHMHIVRVSKRLIDDGNVPAGCKYLIDAFVQFGHLKDDSRKYARITFNQRKCSIGENPHMEVSLSAHSYLEQDA